MIISRQIADDSCHWLLMTFIIKIPDGGSPRNKRENHSNDKWSFWLISPAGYSVQILLSQKTVRMWFFKGVAQQCFSYILCLCVCFSVVESMIGELCVWGGRVK